MTRLTPHRISEILAERVQFRTGGRVFDLRVEVRESQIVLLGTARSYHIKQLALLGARDVAPLVPVRNAIAVVGGVRSRTAVLGST